MVTALNREKLRERGHGYLMGLNRRRRAEVLRYVERATGPWLECPAGVNAGERSRPAKTLVREVASKQAGGRIFVVHSDERQAHESSRRERALQRVGEQLARLRERVARGRLKVAEKIGAAAERILSRHHGYRHCTWELRQGEFHFGEHPAHLRREMALEGKCPIQTEEPRLSAVEAVAGFKEPSEVERAICRLKDVIEMRPIYHQTVRRVEAHLFVAALGFLIDRALEKKLKAGGLDLSSKEAWQILRTVRVVEISPGDGPKRSLVTRGSGRAAQILKLLGIHDLKPAPPRKAGEKVA